MTIKEVLDYGVSELRRNHIDEPISISKKLMCNLLGVDKIYLIVNQDEHVEERNRLNFVNLINLVIQNVPIQYLTNIQSFMKMDFYVNENVLIPRPETEIVVQEAIKLINENHMRRVLDMCTGSGVIAISIAKYSNATMILGVDISDKALEVAEKNTFENGVMDKVSLLKSNMFENISGKYDLIISNPPYIKTGDINSLDFSVRKEPIIALDGGIDGLDYYRIIEENAYDLLDAGGYIVLEIGYNQKEEVMEIFGKRFKEVTCKKDLAGLDRCVICKRR